MLEMINCVYLMVLWVPRYWSNIILGLSVMMFLGEINIELVH